MKILAFEGSPRSNANSSIMLKHFIMGADISGTGVNRINVNKLNVYPCSGCLRCNLIKRCSLRGDDWENLSRSIHEADVIVISSPVYFFHFPSKLKMVLDRFRSFINVKITEHGLIHTPWIEWKKDFVLLLSMGSPNEREGKGMVDSMEFIVKELGEGNRLFTFSGTRLAISGQLEFGVEKLTSLYEKLGIPVNLVENDKKRNDKLLTEIYNLGEKLGGPNGG